MQEYDGTKEALFHPEAHRPISAISGKLDLRAAEYSRLAYVKFETPEPEGKQRLAKALEEWGTIKRLETFSDAETGVQAFAVEHDDGQTFVAFRGTEPNSMSDIASDLQASLTPWTDVHPLAWVHQGFARQFKSVWQAILTWLETADPQSVTFCGHSLGAALATLALAKYPGSRAITIGSPRVGNGGFCALIPSGKLLRYVNCCDVVTELAPEIPFPNGPYRHAGQRIYIDRDGHIQRTWGDAEIAADRSDARDDYFSHLAWRIGTVPVRDLADHAPINYIRALMD